MKGWEGPSCGIIWPPTPPSWGIKEGIPCVAPPQIQRTARHNDARFFACARACVHARTNTHSSAPPTQGYQSPHFELTSELFMSFSGISLPVLQTKTSTWASHSIR